MECPITYEAFEDRGENMPIMLPACGHTISAVAAAQLVATAKAAQESKAKNMPVAIKCPSCAQTQPQVSTVHDLPWNLALIRRLRAKKHREKQQNNHVAERAGDGPPADDGAAGKVGKRSKITFTESGDHQPCVMPACGHTFTRITASRLLEKARASQQAERNDQNLLPSAVACVLSLLCIAAWPDGRVAGFLRVVLLCSCFYVRWRVKIRLIFDTVDPAVPTTLQCPACGTKQPEIAKTLELPPNWMLIEHLREEAAGLAASKGSEKHAVDDDSAGDDSEDSPENIPRKEDQMAPQSGPQAPATGEPHPQEEDDSAPASAHLSKEERDSFLKMDFSYGLSHSERVANRQVLTEAMEAAVWTYIDGTKNQQGSKLLEHLPGFLVVHLIKTVAQSILNSSEHTDIIAGACMHQGTTLNRLIQAHWPEPPAPVPYFPEWLRHKGIPKSEVCTALEAHIPGTGGEHAEYGFIWQLGPPPRPKDGFMYMYMEQLFYDEMCGRSWGFLDAFKATMDTEAKLRSAATKMFDYLFLRAPGDDAILAVLGSRKHRLPELVETCILNAL